MPKVEAPAAPAPRLVRPLGRQAHPVDRFEWQPAAGVTRHTLIVLDAGYEELARREAGGGSEWACDADVAALLARGGRFHWFVLAEPPGEPGRAVKSPIESFESP